MKRLLASALLLGASTLATAARDARFDYQMECQGCHAADGGGTVASVPSLKDHVGKFLDVPGGREFLAQVPGAAQAPLDDEALAQVLNFILREIGHAGRFTPYTAGEVSRLRRTPLTNVAATRAALVHAIELRDRPPH